MAPPSVPPAATPPLRVRGSVLGARISYMRERGTKVFARFLTDLAPEARALAAGSLRPEAWYDVHLFHEMLDAIDAQLGKGDHALCYEVGRYACDANLKVFHKFFLRWSSIHQMLDRASAAWAVHYEGIHLELRDRTPTSVVLQIDHPDPHRGFCLSVKGWIVRMGEHTGVQLRDVDEQCRLEGHEICKMAFTW